MNNDTFDRVGETVLGAPVSFHRLKQPVGAFVYEGRVGLATEEAAVELWTEEGRWHDDGRSHPLDLALVSQKGAA